MAVYKGKVPHTKAFLKKKHLLRCSSNKAVECLYFILSGYVHTSRKILFFFEMMKQSVFDLGNPGIILKLLPFKIDYIEDICTLITLVAYLGNSYIKMKIKQCSCDLVKQTHLVC